MITTTQTAEAEDEYRLTAEEAQALTETAYTITITTLERFGNQLHANHKAALNALLGAMTDMATGNLQGRYAFGIQTGLGKTTCTISWLAALAKLELAGRVTVAVASNEAEALCEIIDALKELGVDMGVVGLLHRVATARYPATPAAIDRPILLLCHARVKTKFLEQFKCRGVMRDVLIYDESLITSSSSICSTSMLQTVAGSAALQCKRNAIYRAENGALSQWLDEVEESVADELVKLKACNATQSVIHFPHRPPEMLGAFALVALAKKNETIQGLIRMAQSPVKVSNFADKGILTYQISVPADLSNIIVLDASNPIRDLVKYDASVKDAECDLPAFKQLGFPLASLKRYDGSVVYRMNAHGGKTSMVKSFKAAHRKQYSVCTEVVDVLKEIPSDESTLLVVFKPSYEKTGPENFVKVLEETINDSGLVNMVNRESKETAHGHPRVSITTWGLHKGTNKHSHCQNIILVGIVHRDLLDIQGTMHGQQRDIQTVVSRQQLLDLQLSEVAHDAFQAIGRAQCRTVINGVALPVKVWLIHYSTNLQAKLETVLPGAAWKKWETRYIEVATSKEPGIIQGTALVVGRYLDRLQERGTVEISSRAVRRDVLECKTLTPLAFNRVVSRALEINRKWIRSGGRLVHAYSAYFPDVA